MIKLYLDSTHATGSSGDVSSEEALKPELSYCGDGRAMLHKSNSRFRMAVPVSNAIFLSNL